MWLKLVFLAVVMLSIPAVAAAQNATGSIQGNPAATFVSNEIIIKLKPAAAAKLKDRLSEQEAAGGASFSASLKVRNHRFHVTGVERVAKGFHAQRARLERIAKADEKTLTAEEKHIAEREKRAPKNAKPSDLDRYFKLTLVPAGVSIDMIAADYASDPDVESAQPNIVYSISIGASGTGIGDVRPILFRIS